MKKSFSFIILLLILAACSGEPERNNVIIGLPEGIESVNPMYAFNITEGNISELLYLSLVGHRWNDEKGIMENEARLAEFWEWGPDSAYVDITLKKNIYWSDSAAVTPEDVIFSYDIYSDPLAQSKFYGTFGNFITDQDNHIDTAATFEKRSERVLRVHFGETAVPSIIDIDLPILPEHIFGKINRDDKNRLATTGGEVVTGPYKLVNNEKFQAVTLGSNKSSYLWSDEIIPTIIFKVIPENSSAAIQLSKGDIDLADNISTQNLKDLESAEDIVIAPVKGRDYRYIGWMNIDNSSYNENGKVAPHPLFGDPKVRRALTCAINRDEMLIGNPEYKTLAKGPVSPIFKEYYNDSFSPLPFDTDSAHILLREAGWGDVDKNGILDKDGIEFIFDLYVTGNTELGSIISDNLKDVGIVAEIRQTEFNTFIDNLYAKNYDAWISGWYVPIPLELKPYWHSDLDKYLLNFQGYQNKKVDSLLEKTTGLDNGEELKKIYYEIQEIIHREQPVTFLYWFDSIAAYNSRIKNIKATPLGIVNNCWEWRLEE